VTRLEGDKATGDVWNNLIGKAEMEACAKIKMVPKSQGVVAHGVLHRRSTDESGVGLAGQARTLTHPAPLKREEELAEHVEMQQDKMRRLEAHGGEFKLASVFKIDALRMFMAGNAKECFDPLEANRDNTDQAKSHEEFLAKVRDYIFEA
jgi:hypothetical protein